MNVCIRPCKLLFTYMELNVKNVGPIILKKCDINAILIYITNDKLIKSKNLKYE